MLSSCGALINSIGPHFEKNIIKNKYKKVVFLQRPLYTIVETHKFAIVRIAGKIKQLLHCRDWIRLKYTIMR